MTTGGFCGGMVRTDIMRSQFYDFPQVGPLLFSPKDGPHYYKGIFKKIQTGRDVMLTLLTGLLGLLIAFCVFSAFVCITLAYLHYLNFKNEQRRISVGKGRYFH